LRDPEAYNKTLLSRQTFIIFKEKFQSLGGIPQKQLQAKHVKASKSMSNFDGFNLSDIETS